MIPPRLLRISLFVQLVAGAVLLVTSLALVITGVVGERPWLMLGLAVLLTALAAIQLWPPKRN